jgi:hypothetical protein
LTRKEEVKEAVGDREFLLGLGEVVALEAELAAEKEKDAASVTTRICRSVLTAKKSHA